MAWMALGLDSDDLNFFPKHPTGGAIRVYSPPTRRKTSVASPPPDSLALFDGPHRSSESGVSRSASGGRRVSDGWWLGGSAPLFSNGCAHLLLPLGGWPGRIGGPVPSDSGKTKSYTTFQATRDHVRVVRVLFWE